MDTSVLEQREFGKDKWKVLTVVSIGTLISTLDGGMMQVGYPSLATAFGVDTSDVLWVTVSFWVTSVGLMLTLGWVGDVAGRNKVFVAGFAVFSLGLIAGASSQNLSQLITSRILQGVGSAMLLSNLNAFIISAFPENERGKAIGISGGIVGVGLSVGPLAGGLLLDLLDWRALMYSRVPIGLVGAVLGWYFLPRDRIGGPKFKVDVFGSIALFASLASFLLFVNRGGKDGFTSTLAVSMAIVAIVSLPILIWSERRSLRPIVDVKLLKDKYYSSGLVVHVCHYLSHGGILLVAPFYIIHSLGYSPTKMGVVISFFYLGRTFFAPLAGRFSDQFGPVPFLVTGNILFALGLLWIGLQGPGTSMINIAMAMLIASTGSALIEPVVTSVIMGSVPPDRIGTASAVVATGRQTSFAIGVAVSGAIFAIREKIYLESHILPGHELGIVSADAISAGFRDSVLVGAVVAVVAVILSMRMRGFNQI